MNFDSSQVLTLTGRITDVDIRNPHSQVTLQSLSATERRPCRGQMWTDALGMQDLDTPRALDTSEIPTVIAQYAQATTNALAAGFDGVELHSASGYLPMQFLSTGSNRRTDGYGGGVHNRIRFVVEALEAMAAAGDASRVGIKISPAMPAHYLRDSAPALFRPLCRWRCLRPAIRQCDAGIVPSG